MATEKNAEAINIKCTALKSVPIYRNPTDTNAIGATVKGQNYHMDEYYLKNKRYRIYELEGYNYDGAADADASEHKKIGWVDGNDTKPGSWKKVKEYPIPIPTTLIPNETNKVVTTSELRKLQAKAASNAGVTNKYDLNSAVIKNSTKISSKNDPTKSTVAQQNDLKAVTGNFKTKAASILNGGFKRGFVKAIEDSGLMVGPEDAKEKYFNKFKRIPNIDPYYTTTNGVMEHLFFTKPDLNIVRVAEGKKGKLVSYLATDSFFVDLVKNHPDAVRMLQYSYDLLPFNTLLSACCKGGLEIPNIDAEVMDGPSNIYGTSIEYRQDGYKSDENISFSLEFNETKNQDILYLFKAYEEYERFKKLGKIRPKYQAYITNKILHDQFGIYKIVTAEDGTIIYYAYMAGVKPLTVPRNAYTTPDPTRLLEYSIDFKAEFIIDKPYILRNFNILQSVHQNMYKAKTVLPVYDSINERINGEWGHACQVKQVSVGGRDKFVLEWYKY